MYYYECHKCMEKIEGHPSNPELDPVKMVKDSKPNTFVFICEPCQDGNKDASE